MGCPMSGSGEGRGRTWTTKGREGWLERKGTEGEEGGLPSHPCYSYPRVSRGGAGWWEGRLGPPRRSLGSRCCFERDRHRHRGGRQ